MKKLTLLLMAFLLALSLSACAGNSANNSKTTTISYAWWGSQESAKTTIEAVKLFEKQNPNIKVKTSFHPFDSYYQTLNISATGGNLPDVFQGYIGDSNVNALIAKGKVEPYDSYIKDGTVNIKDIDKNVIKSCKWKGKIYGMPTALNAKVMYVNPELYKKAGLKIPSSTGYKSYADMARDLVKLKKVTGKYGADDPFSSEFSLPYWCRQHGETLFKNTGNNTIGFSEKTYVDFYKMRINWIKKGLIPPYDVTSGRSGPEDTEIVKGNSAAIVAYTNEEPAMAAAAHKTFVPIMLPGPNTEKGADLRVSSYLHLANSHNSKKMKAAAKLVNFLMNNAKANKVMNCAKGMFVSKKVSQKLAPNLSKTLKLSAQAVNLVAKHSSAPDPAYTRDIVDEQELITKLDQQVTTGSISPQAAYKKLIETGKEQ
ncbi:MAG: ABC transporter substrate-binding protein [Sporolactobacillus sp.]|jgi:multiple sugar transport system substrate-binding protein|nr:ABC transporter substrate-binding protein [Sporolactobacillus sp.]